MAKLLEQQRQQCLVPIKGETLKVEYPE
ncbi:hypothetical protein CCACVL1_18432 [Corchorus capsularis]|uniref:Uncharacterized protein n=1 Tax=Corchorus capsularis TaxID=210143 RepID=A0A1R3HLF8_COCAP|nr:hypothetical protein CCACVL1_18432 [Corchorus capsularis]